MRDGDKLTAWLREAADEIDKAHLILDLHDVPRGLYPEDSTECTLAARVAMALGGELERE